MLEVKEIPAANGAMAGVSTIFGVSPEEKRATGVETQIATELGEATRKSYTDDNPVPVTTCGPISAEICGDQ